MPESKKQIVLVGWKSNRVKEFFGDGRQMDVELSYLEQKERLGTANAIGVAEGFMDGDFVCVNGDVVMAPEAVAEMVAAFQKDRRPFMGAVEVPDPKRFGVVQQEGGKLVRIIEKPVDPPSNLINGGFFGLTDEVFEHIRRTGRSPRGEYEFTDTLNMMAAQTEVVIRKIKGDWMDVGYPWELLRANEFLMGRLKRDIRGTVEEGAVLKGEVVVEEGALVRKRELHRGPGIHLQGLRHRPQLLHPAVHLPWGGRAHRKRGGDQELHRDEEDAHPASQLRGGQYNRGEVQLRRRDQGGQPALR